MCNGLTPGIGGAMKIAKHLLFFLGVILQWERNQLIQLSNVGG